MGQENITQPQSFAAPITATAATISNLNVTSTFSTSSVSFLSGSVFPKTTFNNLVSGVAVQVNGIVLYIPLLSAI